jgi:hypothetical protein
MAGGPGVHFFHPIFDDDGQKMAKADMSVYG